MSMQKLLGNLKKRMCTTNSQFVPWVFHQTRWTMWDLFKAPTQHDLITLYPKESCSGPRRVWIFKGFQQTWPHWVPRQAIPNINMMLIWFNRTPKQYDPTSKIKKKKSEILTLCRSRRDVTNVGKLVQVYAIYLTLHLKTNPNTHCDRWEETYGWVCGVVGGGPLKLPHVVTSCL